MLRKTSPKQFAPDNDPFKQRRGVPPRLKKEKLAVKVTRGSRSVVERAAAANQDRVGKNNRKARWTTDIIHFSKPQRTDPTKFRYEKSNYKDVRMTVPMYSSFTRDGIFREPDYSYKPKPKPKKMVAPRLSDYQATIKSPQAVVVEPVLEATLEMQPELTVVVEKEPARSPTPSSPGRLIKQDVVPQQRVRMARPVSAPPARTQPQRLHKLQSGTIMDALNSKGQRRPFSSQPHRRKSVQGFGNRPSIRPVSAKAVRSSGFQNITMEDMKAHLSEDDEDFEDPVLSRPGSPDHTGSRASLASVMSRPMSAARASRALQGSLSRHSSRPASPMKRMASQASHIGSRVKGNDEDRFWSDDDDDFDNSFNDSYEEDALLEVEEEDTSLRAPPPQPGRLPPKVDKTAPVVRVQLRIVGN